MRRVRSRERLRVCPTFIIYLFSFLNSPYVRQRRRFENEISTYYRVNTRIHQSLKEKNSRRKEVFFAPQARVNYVTFLVGIYSHTFDNVN